MEETMKESRNNSYYYDFSNPGDVAELVEKWGGESTIRNKYPAVWKAIENTIDYQTDICRNPNESSSVRGFVRGGLPELSNLDSKTEVSEEPEKMRMHTLLKLRLEDGSFVSDSSSNEVNNESRCWPYAVLTGNIKNTTDERLIASIGEEYYQTNGADVNMISDLTYTNADFANKYVETNCQFQGLDFNNQLHCEKNRIPSAQFANDTGTPIVSEISVTAPYSEHHNNPIKILYDRDPYDSEKGSIDYSYKNVSMEGNQVKTCIPIRAAVKFSTHNEPADTDCKGKPMDILRSDSDYRPSIFFGSPPKGKIKYNRTFDDIKKAFIKNACELEIDFSKVSADNYWNTNMSKNNYTSGSYEVGRTVELEYSFVVNVKNTLVKIINPVDIEIRSVTSDKLGKAHYYEATNTGTVYIPPLNIRWGCFAAGTRILMADGSRKPVERIGQGDLLYTEKGPLAVKYTYLGREKMLLCVCTEGGRILRVTHTHPVILENKKAVPAKALIPGQHVLLKDGGYDTVRWVFEMEYSGYVYNFEFEDGKEHMVEADGILSGEMIGQNSFRPENVRRQTLTPQTQAIVEQMSAMLKAAGLIKAVK